MSIGIGFCIGIVGIAAALISEPFIKKRMKKDKARDNYAEKSREVYKQKVEYNRAHLPSVELPPINPDWNAVDEFITETRFSFTDNGDRFSYYCFENGSYKEKFIPKSDFDSDTLRLIELIDKDVDWFYANATGETVSEEDETLTGFLMKKYSGLSEKKHFPYIFNILHEQQIIQRELQFYKIIAVLGKMRPIPHFL